MNCYSSMKLDWRVLCWNVRGLNDKDKRLLIYNKIDESNCSVICLQETKCEDFDHAFIRTFCPKRFDRFVFSPSVGASGGLIVLWNSKVFEGQLLEITRSAIRISFFSAHNSDTWTLVNVYGLCNGSESISPRCPFLVCKRHFGRCFTNGSLNLSFFM